MIDAKLVVVGGDAKRSEVPLRSFPIIIGRGRESTLTLPHPLVSRQHCEIFEKEGRLFVKDLASLNGTYVNNHRIVGEHPLDPDQLLTLGNVTFRAIYTQRQSDNQMLLETQNVQSSTDTLSTPVDGGIRAEIPSKSAYQNDVDEYEVDRITVYKHEKQGTTLPESDIDSSSIDVQSHIFVHDTEALDSAKSVSLSALEELPASPAHASFKGNLDLGSAVIPIDDEHATIQIELGEEKAREGEDPNNSALNSFIRKLPK
jgi:pSer/pThr/pTyr-binding forkhead associated (FHA) protein